MMTSMENDNKNMMSRDEVENKSENKSETGYDIKRRDIVLAVCLILAGIAGVVILRGVMGTGSMARVYEDDKLIETIDMSEDNEYTLNTEYGVNVLVVEDGKVRMESADCPDKVCVQMGEKYREGETITCLPHKLVIEVHGGEKQDIDVQ